MRKLFTILCLILSPSFMVAQKVLPLSSQDLDDMNSVSLFDKENWLFYSGHDTSFSNPEIYLAEWIPLSPTQISNQLADENGRIEGWFRLKVTLDEKLASMIRHIYIANYGQAIDFYLNGELKGTLGSTGANGEEYQRSILDKFIPLQPNPNEEITLAFHYVSESPGSFTQLLMQRQEFSFGVRLASNDYLQIRKYEESLAFHGMFFTSTVCFVLFVLFFIIYFQNKNEGILKLILTSSFLFFLAIFLAFLTQPALRTYIEYDWYLILDKIIGIALSLALYTVIVIFSYTFTGRSPKRHGLIIAIIVLLTLEFTFIRKELLAGSLLLGIVAICVSYIISAWRNATRAQWALIVGFLFSLFFLMLLFALSIIKNRFDIITGNLIFLSFPTSLLFYVSFRFNEIIQEVRNKADEVVKLNEEKRQQSIQQQEILEQQVEERTKELNESLDNLKSTQNQLIHSEKMASLGELTAGIAHEIQNPLNFVNNFADLNKELIEELQSAIETNDFEEAKTLANDLLTNEKKVIHHGKRAEEIVKSMLQHSRSGSGEKESTDINLLADEYLRLAYHGLRAKDKSFNADFKTDLDPELPKVNVVPQDIGRVLLNLINNAFQAVKDVEKPQVIVTTRYLYSQQKQDKFMEITVSDNGHGIPDGIKDKIFQPFFTTKAAGEGTGLGLSMSYDIITKGHGGELIVTTNKETGTEFTIHIPLTNLQSL